MGRSRKNNIYVRLSDSEYQKLLDNIKKSGKKTIQDYALDALLNSKITSNSELEEIEKANARLATLIRIERGIATNVNQIAYRANAYKYVANKDIAQLIKELDYQRKEREEIWLLIRSLVQGINHIHL